MSHRSGAYVIAEAGVNHNGSLALALDLVTAAKSAGADAVKFQAFRADRLVTRSAVKAPYQRSGAADDAGQHAMLASLELGPDDFARIARHCRSTGIEFLSSAFDEASVDLLDGLGVRAYKVPSGEIDDVPYLRHVASKGKEVILSTGMAWLGEVELAVRILLEAGAARLTLLHCVSEYPAPYEQINLRAMRTLEEAFGLPVGYSDHTLGSDVAVAAVAMGACVIEKHFTLDVDMPGPDHRSSASPVAFAEMVTAIRLVESALGDGRKRPAQCEAGNRPLVRKSIVAARDLASGTLLTGGDVAAKRPATGIPASAWDEVVGRHLARDLRADEPIAWGHLR